MANLMVVYLSGEERGKTLIFDQDAVTLGLDETCDLRLNIPAARNGHAPDARPIIAEIYRREREFEMFFRDGHHYQLHINRQPPVISEEQPAIRLADGDVLSVRAIETSELHTPAELLLHVMPEADRTSPGNMRLQFPEVDPGGRIHPRTATRFLKELIIGLYAEIPGWARVLAIALTVMIPLSTLVATGIVYYMVIRYSELSKTFTTTKSGAEIQIDELIKENERKNKIIADLNQAVNFAPTINEKYNGGVCLIQGAYIYVNKQTKQPLRYLDRSFNQGAAVGTDGNLTVSFEGTGDIYYQEFTGTGFMVGTDRLLTNRHIAEPWYLDPTDSLIINSLGGQPQVKELYAYFPAAKKRFDIKVQQVSPRDDIALCSIDTGDVTLPILPLDKSEDGGALPGQRVVLLGYPSGVDGLIEQLSDESIKSGLRRRNLADKAAELATAGNIRPQVSPGNVTRLLAGRIVHDASTGEGGSGSPIFNQAGQVIGINAQVMVNDVGQTVPGSNLGIPIRAALDMLKAAGVATDEDN